MTQHTMSVDGPKTLTYEPRKPVRRSSKTKEVKVVYQMYKNSAMDQQFIRVHQQQRSISLSSQFITIHSVFIKVFHHFINRMNQNWVIVIAWLGIASAKIDFQGISSSSTRSQYFNANEQPTVQQQPDSIDRPDDETLSWVDYKRSYASARPYSFNYQVNNDDVDDYGHQQASDGIVTTGSYRVLLPDGRTQIVHFTADSRNGYVANVKYEQKVATTIYIKKPTASNKSPSNYKKKPWTAFNNNKNKMTSYKADLIAAFGLKINRNNKMTSLKTDTTNVHEARAVYHQQENDEENNKPIETPATDGANHHRQAIDKTASSIRNGYVAPTTYRPAVPYSIPSSSTRQHNSQLADYQRH